MHALLSSQCCPWRYGHFIGTIWQFVSARNNFKNAGRNYLASGSEDIRANLANIENFGYYKERY